jgi:geranylgeranyl diphosphate synthase type II
VNPKTSCSECRGRLNGLGCSDGGTHTSSCATPQLGDWMDNVLASYLGDCRNLVTSEIRRIIPGDTRFQSILYDLMLDYPLREGKALRPALCIATCRALGGKLESVLRSAAVLELYHSAFLIHDDIEDESIMRRGLPTLQTQHGIPIAVNVGDAMLGLTLRPLLENIATIGLGPSLKILEAISRMVQESVHGQALELDWVRRCNWDIDEDDYFRMVELKTGWYSFITPVAIGCIVARSDEAPLSQLTEFARLLSIAFQVQDDLLNLSADDRYGKEILGDLWEGKRTIILLHLMRCASPDEKAEVKRILALPRPPAVTAGVDDEGSWPQRLLGQLVEEGHLSQSGLVRLSAGPPAPRSYKQTADVNLLMDLIRKYGSLEHARQIALQWAVEARSRLEACRAFINHSVHFTFLEELVGYVLARVQ